MGCFSYLEEAMKWKANKQEPVLNGVLDNKQRYEVYEEFGLYTIYVEGKLRSTHETIDKVVSKLKYLNTIDRANNHGSNMSPRQKPDRRNKQ